MAAFRAAIELGADRIEFDVQQTSDGHLVVIHDALLDRTTSGRGPVFETSARTIAGLDAGRWFGDAFTDERVPGLDEVLALADVEFELEFKDYDRSLLDSVLGAVDRANVFARVKFTGWNLPLLGLLRSERPDAQIGLFSQPQQQWMTRSVYERHVLGMAETSGANVAHVYAGGITPRIVDGRDAAPRHRRRQAIPSRASCSSGASTSPRAARNRSIISPSAPASPRRFSVSSGSTLRS